MKNLSDYIDLALKLGAVEVVVAHISKMVIDHRFYLKCRFGCSSWNKYWTCPPAPGILKPWEFEKILKNYSFFLAIHTLSDEENQKIAYEVERKAYSDGLMLAFSIYHCGVLCNYSCTYPKEPCRYPDKARPSPSALGIDVSKTAQNLSMNFEFNRIDRYSYVLLI